MYRQLARAFSNALEEEFGTLYNTNGLLQAASATEGERSDAAAAAVTEAAAAASPANIPKKKKTLPPRRNNGINTNNIYYDPETEDRYFPVPIELAPMLTYYDEDTMIDAVTELTSIDYGRRPVDDDDLPKYQQLVLGAFLAENATIYNNTSGMNDENYQLMKYRVQAVVSEHNNEGGRHHRPGSQQRSFFDVQDGSQRNRIELSTKTVTANDAAAETTQSKTY